TDVNVYILNGFIVCENLAACQQTPRAGSLITGRDPAPSRAGTGHSRAPLHATCLRDETRVTRKRKTTRRAPRRASGRAQVTIHQIAEEAGVSTATVSRALNFPDKVRPETRERILDIIRRRHYVSDALAASLASRRSGTIGVIIPTIVYSIYAGFIHAIQKTCGSAGYTVLTGISEYSGALEDEIVTRLLERRVDGLVLTGVDREAAVYRKINSVGVSFVTTWNVSNDAKIPSVSFDNFNASMSAMA